MFIDGKLSEVVNENKIIFIDNDFLGLLYQSKGLLKDTLNSISNKKLFLHPFTEFEFLRDVFAPEQRSLKEKFISSPTFGHIKPDTHLKVFQKVFDNSLLLSKIFAHQKQLIKNNSNKAISFVDLQLSSLLMYLKDKSILITGNKKDFPSCVFDILAIINFETKDGSVRAISVISFNQNKFDSCHKSLEELK